VTLETLKAIAGEAGTYASLTVETCAYAGTGNVLKVQKLLSACGQHPEKEQSHQGAAVLGIALVAMGEDLGKSMAARAFDHLLQYGEPPVRRAVPLGLGLLYVGDPAVTVMDTLSKLSHDQDADVAQAAIFALGLIGAGTNNSRAAKLLRGLSAYYYKEPNHLFVVRIAQGLLHMGKGTLALAPYHSEGLMHRVAVAGLLATLHAALDMKNSTAYSFITMVMLTAPLHSHSSEESLPSVLPGLCCIPAGVDDL
jgi:26S proteasome regulatory subunit N1